MDSDQAGVESFNIYFGGDKEEAIHLGSIDASAPGSVVRRTFSQEDYEFIQWWLRVTIEDLRATIPKMIEYGGVEGQSGSADLIVMGDAQAELMGHHDMDPPWKQALACWFYLLGKVARMVSNFKRRDWPKQDTVHDARVYLMMIQRLADRGRWP